MIPRPLVDPVVTNACVIGIGIGIGVIFRNRVMQSFGERIRIASASGAGTTVTLEFQNFKDRIHRSYQ
ncbi:ATP-binding protein [Paraburkholderia bryophila]|uniref:ATP-binding protein n=1 Tax=Paraburkholderia bryophila TaxID=420952 RepID=UPI002349C2C4|nr:ATP-binding protein [Paraburkholderia bryophila]WCM24662.1 ATP-binding protein [Paraburkholderia bryophila]